MTCPIADETCRACPACEGGRFEAPTPPCECGDSGCSTHPVCEHGNLVDEDDPCLTCTAENAIDAAYARMRDDGYDPDDAYDQTVEAP